MSFREIDIRELPSPVKLINDEWMLIASGDRESYNMMTASWGGIGELWNKDVVFAFIRPQRYTYEFVEKKDYFTLSFFEGGEKKALSYCGSKSGRDYDKAKETGLTPVFESNGVYFEQSKIVVICKKIAYMDIDPQGFLDKTIELNYHEDYHRMYVGEIKKVLKNN